MKNSDSILDNAGWKQRLKDWTITDCAIRDKNIIYLLARKNIPHEEASLSWDHDIPTRLVAIYLDEKNPEKNHGVSEVTGFNKPRCGVSRVPAAQGLIAARNADGQIYAVGGGKPSSMEFVSKGNHPGIQRIKCIQGISYAVCQGRNIFKRIDFNKWVSLTKDIKKSKQVNDSDGFYDVDGPQETCLYAVGGQGDVWFFDGKVWTQCSFPSNEQLSTVTVVDADTVYIGGEGGNIWMGSGNKWTKVHEGNSSVLYRDTVWFDKKLWASSDFGLFVLDNGILQRPTQAGSVIVASGHMDAYDGILLCAGQSEVVMFDGKKWITVVKHYS
jgi:hypothetical protein